MERDSPWEALSQACRKLLTEEKLRKLASWFQDYYPSFESVAASKLREFLSVDQTDKVRSLLRAHTSHENMPQKVMLPEVPSRTRLYAQILEKVCEQDIDETEKSGLIQKLQEGANDYTEERLVEDLIEFVGKKKIEQVRKELAAINFWDQESEANKDSPLPSYKQDQLQLKNYIEDFKRIPELGQPPHRWPLQKQLMKCLIDAFISAFPSLRFSDEQFKKTLNPQQFIEEIQKIVTVAEYEGRMTKKIKKCVDQLLQIGNQPKKASSYDLLLTIRRELVPIDVADLCRLLEKTNQTKGEINGKDIVLFIGDTGSGKTTTIKALLGYKMGLQRHKGMKFVTIVEPILDQKVSIMESNPECKSVSRYVVAVRPRVGMTEREIYLTDTPGIGDTGGIEVQISNGLAITTALRHCRSVVPVIVISQESWGLRGEGFRNLARSLANLFHSYDNCKESVLVLLNRFTSEDMKELPNKLENLLQTTHSADVVDHNYIGMLEHFLLMSHSGQLYNIDILNNSEVKKFLNEILLAKQPLLDPMNLFNHEQNCGGAVKQYCSEVKKIVDFHLKKRNLSVAEYFLNEAKKFYLATQHELLEEVTDSLTKRFDETVRQKYQNFVGSFNSKAFTGALQERECEQYHQFMHNMELNSSGRSLNSVSWVEEAKSNLKFVIDTLISMLTKGNELDTIRIQALLENLKMLVKVARRNEEGSFAEIYQLTGRTFVERAEAFIEDYIELLSDEQFQEAVKAYDLACRNISYGLVLADENPTELLGLREEVEKYLVNQISNLVESGCLIVSSQQPDMEQLIRLDNTLRKIGNSHALLGCQQQVFRQAIILQFARFNDSIREFVKSTSTSLLVIINNAKITPIGRQESESFRRGLEILSDAKRLLSVSDFAGGWYHQVKSSLERFIESREELVSQVAQRIRNTSTLKAQKPVDIAAAVLGLNCFVAFTMDQDKMQSVKDLSEKIMESLKEFESLVVHNQRDSASEVGIEKLRNCEIFEGFEDVYTLENIFSIFAFKGTQIDTTQLKHLRQGMEWMLMDQLRSSPGIIEGIVRKEQGQDFYRLERVLKFIRLAASKFPGESIRAYAETTDKTCKPLMTKLSEALLFNIHDYSTRYYGMQILSENLRLLEQQECEASYENTLKGFRQQYSKAWLEFYHAAQIIFGIFNDCPTLASALDSEKDPLDAIVKKELVILSRALQGEHHQVNQEEKRIEMLEAITRHFGSLESNELEHTFGELQKHSSFFMTKLLGLAKTVLKESQVLLANKKFSAFVELVEKSQEDGDIRDQLLNQIVEYKVVYELEKKRIVMRLVEQEETFSMENATECDRQTRQMNEFLKIGQYTKSDALRNCLVQLQSHIVMVKVKVCKSISIAIKDKDVLDAYKQNEELARIEAMFPDDLRSPPKQNSITFTNMLIRIFEEYKDKISRQELTEKDCRDHFRFFNEAKEIKLPRTELRELILLWEHIIERKVYSVLQKYSSSKKDSDTKKYRDQLERLVEYLSTDVSKTFYKQEILQAEEQLKKQARIIEKEIEEEFSRLPKTSEKLHFESIRPAFNKAVASKSKKTQDEFDSWLLDICKRRKESFKKYVRPLSHYSRLLLTEVYPFFEEIGKSRFFKETRQTIEEEFESAYHTRLDSFCEDVQQSLLGIGLNGTDQSTKKCKVLLEFIEDIYQVLIEALERKELKKMQSYIVKTYERSIQSVINFYESKTNHVKIERLFDGSDHEEYYPELRAIWNLEECVKRVQVQLAHVKNQVSNKFWETSKMYAAKAAEGQGTESGSKTNESKCEAIRKRMMESIEFVEKFDINNKLYANVDEVTLTESLNKFKNAILSAHRHPQLYRLLLGNSISLKDHEQKLQRSMSVLGEEALKRLEVPNDICDAKLEGLNDFILKLTTYQKIYPQHKCLAKEVGERLEQIIINGEKLGKLRMQQCLKTFTQNEKKISKLREAQNVESGESEKTMKAKQEKKVQEVGRKLLLGGNNKDQKEVEKRALMDIVEKEMTAERMKANKEIQDKYRPNYGSIEQENIQSFHSIAKILILFKMMEMTLKGSYTHCKAILEGFIELVGKCGKQYANLLAKALDCTGDNYAVQLIKEYRVFDSYSVKLFKFQLENYGIEYVADKLASQRDERTVKLDSTADDQEKKYILHYYKEYSQMYNRFTEKYRIKPGDNTLNELKDAIKSKALEVKDDIDSGRRSSGHQLLALIFALWSVSKANRTADGVEYLYDPHPAQVTAIFTTLGLTSNGKLGNRLTEVLTGEGKSVVMAGMACYLALIGYEVSCVCYSKLLSQRDHKDFKELFQHLSIEDYVIYSIFEDTSERLLNSKKFNLRDKVESVILNRQPFRGNKGIGDIGRKKILLVDEVDVFFSEAYFGKLYSPVITLKSRRISKLADFVWHHENNNLTFKKITKSQEFVDCIKQYPQIVPLLKYNAVAMLEGIKGYKHDYIIHNGGLAYVRPEGITDDIVSWQLTFAHYYEVQKGTIKTRPQDHASFNIDCGHISYAQLPAHYDYIMGVSGTLKTLPECQKQVLSDWYKIKDFYYIPSVYGECRRQNLGAKLVSASKHFAAVSEAAKIAFKKGQPVLVFFRDFKTMNEFYVCAEFTLHYKRTQILSQRNDEHEIRNRVSLATRSKNVTLLTKAFGRGIDFVVVEKAVKDAGGVHVIQTFISAEESESLQIEGRTARQGEKGTFELIAKQGDLEEIGLGESEQLMRLTDPVKIYQLIRAHQRMSFSESYKLQVAKAERCKANHKEALRIIGMVDEGNKMGVRSAIEQLNEVEIPNNNKKRRRY